MRSDQFICFLEKGLMHKVGACAFGFIQGKSLLFLYEFCTNGLFPLKMGKERKREGGEEMHYQYEPVDLLTLILPFESMDLLFSESVELD